jgi:hypothetical protein
MKLRQLFEGMGQEVAIIFGRFNPPHKGHRAAWELAAKSPVWYVGTNESTVGPKDPLPYGIKVEAMTAIWPEVEGHIIAETSWLTLASLVYEKHGDVTLLCLTDEDWVTKTIVQYNGKEGGHGFYNFKTIKQKPTPRLSSATALRDAVTKDDREAFANAAGVPADTPVAGKPFFDLVAEYLLPYASAPKKVAKKKAPIKGLDEFAISGDDGEDPADNYPCYDCGSTIFLHHTKLCELAEDNAIRDLPAKQRSQHWTGEIPKGLHPIPGLQESMLPASAFAGSSKYKMGQAGQWRNDGPSKNRPARRGDLVGSTDESEGSPEGLPHLTKTMLTHIVQQVGTEGAHAIIKSLEWGDGASKELLHLIVQDIEDDIKANDFKQEDAAGVGIITKQNSTVDVNKGTPRKNLKAFRLA